jgi:hypothetical protein
MEIKSNVRIDGDKKLQKKAYEPDARKPLSF